MNWRRGLLLAGIHLAVAIPILLIEESFLWPYLRADRAGWPDSVRVQQAAFQEEQTVNFLPDPCDLWRTTPAPLMIVASANFPAGLLSGWGNRCSPTLPMARLSAAMFGETTKRADVFCLCCLILLIPIQWVLIGGFPLVQASRWWRLEPGASITACAPVGVGISLIPWLEDFGRLFAWLMLIGWLYLVICATVKAVRLGWQRVRGPAAGRI